MGNINAKRKGNQAEANVAELMSKWTGKIIKRADNNNLIHSRTALNSKGDIICKTEGHYFPFCTEVKFYKEINFEHLLYLPKPKILDFWNQVVADGKLSKKCPLLFMRYNGLPKDFFFIAISLKIYDQVFSQHISASKSLRSEYHDFILITSTDFFKIPYKEIRKPIRAFYKTFYK
jgi:hypothetical protein